MKSYYDLIIGLSTHKSAQFTINLIESANVIDGDVLFFVTSCIDDDCARVVNNIKRFKKDIVVCKTNINNRYFSNNWSFISCINSGIQAAFFGTMDDDILFENSEDLIERLYKADDIGFSVLGFQSTSHPYTTSGKECSKDKEFRDGLLFIDGHNMFTRFTDNILYGLCDSWGKGNISYVEVEYGARMTYFTGRPLLADVSKQRINHCFRSDPALLEIRKVGAGYSDMNNGVVLYKKKYGINIDLSGAPWDEVIPIMNERHESMKQHVMYDGLWTEWYEIYQKYYQDVKCVYKK